MWIRRLCEGWIGWYQRTITISENDIKSRQIILYFEGVYMKSSVFVNGTYAGGHIYGYTPFEVHHCTCA